MFCLISLITFPLLGIAFFIILATFAIGRKRSYKTEHIYNRSKQNNEITCSQTLFQLFS